MKCVPNAKPGAHATDQLAELVCSNSLGSTLPDRASGVLKTELRQMGSLLLDLDVVFLDGLRLESHPTHFHMEESLQMAQKIGAKKTYLIHLTHDYDHDEFNKTLPKGTQLAYDGLVVNSAEP